MADRDEAGALRLVVVFLRFLADMTQVEFGKASQVHQADISRYEKGTKTLPEETLKRMAKAANVDWSVVVHLRRDFATVLSATTHRSPVPVTKPLSLPLLEPVLLAVTPYLLAGNGLDSPRQTPKEAWQEAEQIWTALERYPIARRRRLIELAPRASRSSALAARVCAASRRAAAHTIREALELADLALSITERLPDEADRFRAQGYSWAHVANARRVANDHAGADEAFARAWALWHTGKDDKSDLFPEWRLLSLEASLRRDQRRLPEALELLDRARAVCTEGEGAKAEILLNKETVLDLLGDLEGALAVLSEVAPLVEASGNHDLLLRLLFNKAVDLGHLEHYAEAAALLPRVRELATEQANELDLLRVDWLEARIAAGEGRTAAAQAGLEEVRRKFADLGLPYDAALASLDLAVLWLKAGHSAKVKVLAVEMEAIFRARKIHREAFAALALFWEAAQRETATVELVRHVITEIEKAKSLAPPVERSR